jgi:hypothetical protein
MEVAMGEVEGAGLAKISAKGATLVDPCLAHTLSSPERLFQVNVQVHRGASISYAITEII